MIRGYSCMKRKSDIEGVLRRLQGPGFFERDLDSDLAHLLEPGTPGSSRHINFRVPPRLFACLVKAASEKYGPEFAHGGITRITLYLLARGYRDWRREQRGRK